MKNTYAITGSAGIGAVALALLVAGCGGSGSPLGPTAGSGLTPSGVQTGSAGESADLASPDRFRRHHHHHGACVAVTNSQNFNGQSIAKGSWIWFSSVTSFPGNNGNVKVEMRDSKISFSDGTKNYTFKGPGMHLKLAGDNVRFKVVRRHGHFHHGRGHFDLGAPVKTAGNDLLGAIAYQAPADLPGGIQNVTWSAKFYSKAGVKAMHWQWGAAVYTRMTDNYKKIGVKPLDDNHYPPYSSDHAGTPENFKAYLTSGATGGGGANYTGGLGPTINVTPCK